MKRFIILIVAISMICCITACDNKPGDTTVHSTDSTVDNITSSSTTDSTDSTDSTATIIDAKKILRKQDVPNEYERFADYLTRVGIPWNAEIHMDIPVYYDVDLFYSDIYMCGWRINHDGSYGLDQVPIYHYSSASDILAAFPKNAIRVREDGTSYAIYDSDTGYRLYVLFTTPKEGYTTGYPILINKNKALLSRSSFDAIQIGDPFEKVEAIDDVASIHMKSESFTLMTVKHFQYRANQGDPFVTVHYLKDGLLIIEYTMIEHPNVIVSNISFYEDYVVPTADGLMTSHKIKDIDLPGS